MKDFAGNELEVGDRVICLTAGRSTSWMIWGEVIGFTPQKVRIEYVSQNYTSTDGRHVFVKSVTLRDPSGVVLPLTPETFYAIQQECFANANFSWKDHVTDNR